MTFPTSAEIKVKLGGRAGTLTNHHLIFTYCGGLKRRTMGLAVKVGDAMPVLGVDPYICHN